MNDAIESASGAVVAGYDGSTEADEAVDWAAAEASRLGNPLVVAHAATFMQPITKLTGRNEQAGQDQEASGSVADAGADRARRTARGISVTPMTYRSGASGALTEASRGAALVVVGNRGRGRVTGALLGSVAFALATHAQSPMVVVRGSATEPPSSNRPVLVGVDGSGNAALDHATDVAADTGVGLHVMVAWQGRRAEPWDRTDLATVHATDDAAAEAEQAATTIAEDAVERATSRRPDVQATPVVTAGRPEQALVDATTGCALVVVGARGRGDFASLLLGSVSRSVIHRAECPVTIIR